MTSYDSIHQIIQEGQQLRNELPNVLTLTSPEAIEEEMTKREDYKDRLQEAMNTISDEIDGLRGFKRSLELQKDYMNTDLKKLKPAFYEGLRRRKQQNL